MERVQVPTCKFKPKQAMKRNGPRKDIYVNKEKLIRAIQVKDEESSLSNQRKKCQIKILENKVEKFDF
jgi:hypothetical protein